MSSFSCGPPGGGGGGGCQGRQTRHEDVLMNFGNPQPARAHRVASDLTWSILGQPHMIIVFSSALSQPFFLKESAKQCLAHRSMDCKRLKAVEREGQKVPRPGEMSAVATEQRAVRARARANFMVGGGLGGDGRLLLFETGR